MERQTIPGRQLCRLMLVLILSGFSLFAQGQERVDVTSSIHPLSLLVSEIAGDQVDIHTLVSAGQSPHTFQMRPSDRRALAKADFVFWIGPAMELFLQNLMNQSGLRDKAFALGPRVQPEPMEAPHAPSEDRNHEHEEHTAEEHGHDHGGEDPHIWLEPGLARAMAREIAALLKQDERIDDARIDANLATFEARLAATDQAIREALAKRQPADLFTYHAAFGLFAAHYGIEIAGSLTFNPEIQPGARHLAAVQERLQAADRACILTEPQFSRDWWQPITGDVEVDISQWDPLASTIEPGKGSYTHFLQTLAQAVLNCGSQNTR